MLIRVLVADPHVLVATALCAWLDRESDIDVLEVAECGEDTVRRAAAGAPDVLVLEALLEAPSGLNVVRRLAENGAPTRALVVSQIEQPWLAQAMLEAGAWGYLLKRDVPRLVAEAIRGVAAGQDGWISPALAQAVSARRIAHRAGTARPHPARMGGAPPRGRGAAQPGDRRAARSPHGHGQKPRAPHPAEAGPALAPETHRLGAPARRTTPASIVY